MTMKFLKFPDKETCDAALEAAGLRVDFPESGMTYITDSHTHSLDVVGIVYRYVLDPAPVDPDNIYTVIALDGWHANFIGTLPPELEPYLIPTPVSPYRVFAGY